MTKEEFEEDYAKRSGVTVEWLHEHNMAGAPCTCDESGCEGWAMVTSGEDTLLRSLADAEELLGAISEEDGYVIKVAEDAIRSRKGLPLVEDDPPTSGEIGPMPGGAPLVTFPSGDRIDGDGTFTQGQAHGPSLVSSATSQPGDSAYRPGAPVDIDPLPTPGALRAAGSLLGENATVTKSAFLTVAQPGEWKALLEIKPIKGLTYMEVETAVYKSFARMLPKHPEEVAALKAAGIVVEVEGKELC